MYSYLVSNDNEYMREYMKKRYYRRRAAAIEQLGGRCVDCGSTENLQFDHVDRLTKSFDLAKAFAGWSDERIQAELVKCVLRCKPHHDEKSRRVSDLPQVDHGGGKTGKKNCYCDKCAPLKRAYNTRRKREMKQGTWVPTYDKSHAHAPLV